MAFYLVVRGPLGVGKTTVARRVAAAVGAEYLSIDALLEAPGLEEWERGYISERSFLRVNRRAAPRVRSSLERGVSVVLDGNFYWKRQIEDLIRQLPFRHVVVTLCAPLDVCIERDQGRPRSYGAEATRDVYAKSTEFDYGIPVPATGSPAEVVLAVLEQLPRPSAGGRPAPKA